MLCPECNIEARISNRMYVMKNGKLFIRYEYSCRNKGCTRFDKPIGEEDDEVKNLIIEDEPEEPTDETPQEEVTTADENEAPVEEPIEET